MTDNEIIKSMQCVIGNGVNCSECAYQKTLPFPSCTRMCAKNALDLIKRQNAEIERLNIESETLATQLKGAYEQIHKLNMAKSEAIKEFAHLVIDRSRNGVICVSDVSDLVKEMTEENENDG